MRDGGYDSFRSACAHPPATPCTRCPAVKLRIRATNNVAKITNVMKLVASSKLKAVEDALAKGRVFGVRANTEELGARFRTGAFGVASPLFADPFSRTFLCVSSAIALPISTTFLLHLNLLHTRTHHSLRLRPRVSPSLRLPCATPQQSLLEAVSIKEAPKPRVDEDAARGVFLDGRDHLCVILTTDRGLCGSVNSSLTRGLRKELAVAAAAGAKVRLFVIGEKGRAQIARDNIPITVTSIDGYSDRDPIFPLAASFASRIVSNSYEVLTLCYNTYENQIKFHDTYAKIPKIAGALPPSLKSYEVEPEGPDTLVNLEEYAVASALYYCMLETTACETSQRVTAMDNASTNAKDMVGAFKLTYNRARQAKITTELSEIISGSESLVVSTVSD